MYVNPLACENIFYIYYGINLIAYAVLGVSGSTPQ